MRGSAKREPQPEIDIADALPDVEEIRPKKRRSRMRIVWLFADYLFDAVLVSVQENAAIMRRESQLFLGSALLVLGLFGFESGKYCDGNTANYLSCTRPATYYYYDYLDFACIIIGISLLLLWYIKRRS
jgi:hypothetical protein